jgi:predicted SAM-dependent methyltransferase
MDVRSSLPDIAVPARLNWGCGPKVKMGWINVDRHAFAGVDVQCDVLAAKLPFASRTFDFAVAMHVLQDMPWAGIPVALAELHRVLKPAAVLRLGLPDLDRAIAAYQRGDSGYFHVPDSDAVHIGSKFVTQIIWYGSVLTPFTFEFAQELLQKARFTAVQRCAFGRTGSPYPEIVELDNRPRESMFIEAAAGQLD